MRQEAVVYAREFAVDGEDAGGLDVGVGRERGGEGVAVGVLGEC